MITLAELHYFGNLAYWTSILASSEVILEGHEHYQKRSFRNKMEIASSTGVATLSIPLLKGKHQQQPIQEVSIAYHDPWPQRHVKTLETCYQGAPYYGHYRKEVEALIMNGKPRLWEFNRQIFTWIVNQIGLNAVIKVTMDYKQKTEPEISDLRNLIRPKKPVPQFEPWPYAQVFENRLGFTENLSILDLLFCYGPHSVHILNQCKWKL